MLIEQLDKFIRQADIVDKVNNIGRLDNINDLVEYVLSGDEDHKARTLSMLDKDKRAEVEKLIDGGIL